MARRRQMYKLRYAQVPIVFVVAAMLMVVALFTVINLRLSGDIQLLTGQVSDGSYAVSMKQKEVADMAEKLQLASTDDFIANEARTQHGFLSEGEIRFVVVNPEVLWGEEVRP